MITRRKIQKLIFGACAFSTIAAGSSALQNDGNARSRFTPKSRAALHKANSRRSARRFNLGRSEDPQITDSTTRSDSILMPFAAGDLDTGFDGDGKVTTQLGGSEDVALSVAPQSDGKIVCAGYSSTGTTTVAFVVRYNTDGSLDNSFDGDGKVTQNFGVGFTLATSVKVQSDGKILVAGYTVAAPPATSGFDLFLLRYNSDGTLDSTFDGDGKVTTDFASRDEADALFVQPDGKIVVVGYTNNNTADRTFAVLVRYNDVGTLDTSFGSGGKVLGHEGAAYSALIQPDGQIVTGGWGCSIATCTQNLDFTFARYNGTDGSPDATFGTGGKATVAVSGGRDEAREIALQPDGKIVAAGVNLSSSAGDPVAVVRLNTNGTTDASFGAGGIVQNLPIAVENVFGLKLQADGKIVTGGRVYPNATDSDFAVVRLNTDGTPDTRFSGDGFAITAFTSNLDGILDFAIQNDGKIVAVGFAENQVGDIDAAAARYITSVSISGKVLTPDMRGLRNAIVKITDAQNVTQSVTTSTFGVYTFDNVQPGQTYTIKVFSKLYRFNQRTQSVGTLDLTGIDFVGME